MHHPAPLPGFATALPRVVLIDLDGTLIGRVDAPVCEYELIQMLPPAARARCMRAAKEQLVARLRYGIIRPHVEAFVKAATQHDSGLELFVFTASEPAWAANIITCVETALGMRFNRPLLTRKHCVQVRTGPPGSSPELRKSLDKVLPLVQRALVKRWPAATSPALLADRIMLVDNTPGVMVAPEAGKRLVVCPTYTYLYLYDVLTNIPVDVLHRRFTALATVLSQHGLFPKSPAHAVSSYQHFSSLYYAHLSAQLQAARGSNLRSLTEDRFWSRMIHALVEPSQAGARGAFTQDMMHAITKRASSQANSTPHGLNQGGPRHKQPSNHVVHGPAGELMRGAVERQGRDQAGSTPGGTKDRKKRGGQ